MKRMNSERRISGSGRFATVLIALLAIALMRIVTARAQSFSSGSDGTDGALNVPANQGTVIFDPRETVRWGRVLDSDGDGVYNFTTITVGSGSTLRLGGDTVNAPVYWLASGDVIINGTVDLSGVSLSGCCVTDLNARRQVALPGSGGFSGGAGGITGSSVGATQGDGPGGGAGGLSCAGGDVGTNSRCGKGGAFTGNRYLIPLIGGSGGEGAVSSTYINGGGGGGAILIASSTVINLIGAIRADGGASAWGNSSGGGRSAGGGSGGAIRVVAPTISGNGHLNVRGGFSSNTVSGASGSAGWVRLEGFVISTSLVFDAGSNTVTIGSPVDPSSLRPASSIRVTAINGVSVPANPTGSFLVPDATISSNAPVSVEIAATGVPPGTIVTLQVFPQTPTDLSTIYLPTAQATLAGTVESSTATASFTFPYGFSRGFVRATWTQ